MPSYAALDVSQEKTAICVVDETGRILAGGDRLAGYQLEVCLGVQLAADTSLLPGKSCIILGSINYGGRLSLLSAADN